MKRNFLLSGVLALVLSFALVPGLAAQDGTYEGEYTGGGGGGDAGLFEQGVKVSSRPTGAVQGDFFDKEVLGAALDLPADPRQVGG